MKLLFLLAMSIVIPQARGLNAIPKPPVTEDSFCDCHNGAGEFKAICVNQFKGVADGPRCYFVVDIDRRKPSPWDAAWEVCQSYKSVLAQIHTKQEYTKVLQYITGMLGPNFSGRPVMLGLKDDVTDTGKRCAFDSQTISWYKDATTVEPLVVVNHTWLARAHGCDDQKTQGMPRCIRFYPKLKWQTKGGPGIDDNKCSAKGTVALCQYTSLIQRFQTTDICMGEPPVVTRQTTKTEGGCSALCAAEPWCRSYNRFKLDEEGESVECELFSWSNKDTTVTKEVEGCTHYDYDDSEE